MTRTTARISAVLILVLCVGTSVAVGEVWRRIHAPYRGFTGTEQFVDIPEGEGAIGIGQRLVDAGIISDTFSYRVALWWTDAARDLRAGEYRFDAPLTPVEVVRRLTEGDVYTRRITFPEGLMIEDMARVYERAGFGPAKTFVQAAADPSPIADLDTKAGDLEGYLFPDTYTMARDTSAERLVELMLRRFRAEYDRDLQQRAEERGLTAREVVTLASIVEKETANPKERTLVAAVFANRLKIGMGLQTDPTVVYALRKAGRYDGNIRRADLSIDSPYNTYRNPGLPPGPIAAPGRAALEAALEPADVDYLYFVSRNDGSHAFARTLAEHNRNVQEFQVLFFRRRAAGG